MNNSSVLLTVGVFACLLACGVAIRMKDCGSNLAKLSAIAVAGCESSDVCKLTKGSNVSFEVDFVPKQNDDKLSMLVYGHIAGIDVPFSLPNPDACNNCNVVCPVESGKSYQYRNNIFVKDDYPSLSLAVKLKLVDSTGAVLICGMVQAQIVSKSAASKSVL